MYLTPKLATNEPIKLIKILNKVILNKNLPLLFNY